MNRLNADSAISLSLSMVLCGVIWKASVTHSMAATAMERIGVIEQEMSHRRDLNDEFKEKVISDLSAIKARLGVEK